MKKTGWLLLPLLFIAGCAGNLVVNKNYDVTKIKRVAVAPFSGVDGYPTIGVTAANEFNYALLKYGFSVVERSSVDKVFGEQALSNSGAVNAETIKNAGKLLGADVVVMGAVERLKPENSRDVSYGVQGESGGAHRTVQAESLKPKEIKKAEVSVNFRLVDVETGEVVSVGSDSAEGKTLVIASQKAAVKLAKSLRGKVDKMTPKTK